MTQDNTVRVPRKCYDSGHTSLCLLVCQHETSRDFIPTAQMHLFLGAGGSSNGFPINGDKGLVLPALLQEQARGLC